MTPSRLGGAPASDEMNPFAHPARETRTMDDIEQDRIATAAEAVRPHGRIARLFHWGFIVVSVYALTKQLDGVEELEDSALLAFEMRFASAFPALVVVRYLYMRLTRPMALPANTPRHEHRLARAVHLTTYAGLAVIAAGGLTIGALYGAGSRGGLALDAALLVHEIASNSTFFLIAGHVAATLYHRRQRDGIWSSMVPLWTEREEG